MTVFSPWADLREATSYFVSALNILSFIYGVGDDVILTGSNDFVIRKIQEIERAKFNKKHGGHRLFVSKGSRMDFRCYSHYLLGGQMLRSFSISNFQGFAEPQTINLNSGNLIFGENSSGKSAILRAILLISQSHGRTDNNTANYLLRFQGEAVNLASYKNAVHLHQESSIMNFEIDFSPEKVGSTKSNIWNWNRGRSSLGENKVSRFRVSLSHGSIGWKQLSVAAFIAEVSSPGEESDVTFHFEPDEAGKPRLVEISDPHETFRRLTKNSSEQDEALKSAKKAWSGINSMREDLEKYPEAKDLLEKELKRAQMLLHDAETANRASTTLEELLKLEFSFAPSTFIPVTRTALRGSPFEELLYAAHFAFRRAFDFIEYVPGIRDVRERAVAIEQDQSREARSRATREHSETVVSDYLSRITNGRYAFVTEWPGLQGNEHLGQYEVTSLVDQHLDVKVAFRDAGMGLSQVLPVLEALNRLENRGAGILLVEQPELHLHPAIQTTLVDLFIEVMEKNPEIQIFAETHSESMLLRLEKRVRENPALSERFGVSYVYFDPAHGSQVTEMVFEESEDYSIDLPKSFSNLRLEEIL